MENVLLITVALGALAIQFFLVAKDSAVPGLILPVIVFLLSFLFAFSASAPADGVTGAFVLQRIGVFLLSNIPTAVLVFIYLLCRGKLNRKSNRDDQAE